MKNKITEKSVSKQNAELDYTGCKIGVGIDMHLKSWRIGIMVGQVFAKSYSQEPSVEQLISHLHKHYPNGDYECVYESGHSGYWLAQELQSHGINCIVVHAADVPTTDKERRYKTDKRDSRKLAKGLSNGDLQALYIPPKGQQYFRSLVRMINRSKVDERRIKNRIKMYLHFFGIKIPDELRKNMWVKRGLAWLACKGQEFGHSGLLHLTKSLSNRSKEVSEGLALLKSAWKDSDYMGLIELLSSVPGVGFWSAAVLASEIGDMRRFASLCQLCSYVGLVPTTKSSGDKERVGHMSKRGNRYIRYILIECAWVAIRHDPVLTLYYNQCLEGSHKPSSAQKNRAIIKVARKLLNRIRAVWISHSPYLKGFVK